VAQAVFFGGAILGGLIFGWVADRYGRIPALVWTNLIGFVAGIATSFVTTFWAFCVCRFLVGLAFDNCFTMMYILGKYLSYLHTLKCLEIVRDINVSFSSKYNYLLHKLMII
jgi:MFS family permease